MAEVVAGMKSSSLPLSHTFSVADTREKGVLNSVTFLPNLVIGTPNFQV